MKIEDGELLDALVAYQRIAGDKITQREFEEVIQVTTIEIAEAGNLMCQCGSDRRSHIIRALNAGGRFDHRFQERAA